MFGEGMSDQEVENLMEQVDDNPNLNYMLLNYLMYGDQDDGDDDDDGEDEEAEWDPDDDDEEEDEEDEEDEAEWALNADSSGSRTMI